jgi:intracellular sulfur oxidation DsrE/DsrF family protein
MQRSSWLTIAAVFCILTGTPVLLHADVPQPDDRVALKGMKQAKAIFDVRLADLDKLLFNLALIKETHEGISNQKVKPQLMVTLRGPAVRLFTRDQAPEELKELLNDLKQKGIRLEICSVATRVFKVDNRQLLPDVTLVGNVLTSQIAMQNKGYALITLN